IEERTTTPDFYDIINDTPQPASLADILDAIEAAADDDNILGIYLKCDGASAGIATRKAIRDAVVKFKDSGKWVISYSDTYSQGDYYIASASDEIYLNPVGGVELKGLATGIPFFKNFLDKAGVEIQVIKVGTFKSAVEPYILTGMSEANRLQTRSYLDNMWNYMAEEIAVSRDIPTDSLNMLADSALVLTPATDLEALKIIDGLKYGNEMNNYLKELCSITKKDQNPRLVSVSSYLESGVELLHSKSQKKKIAVYYASGDITESAKDGIASDRVVPDIIKLAEDDDIDALVLRVNSGGGSAFASEQIWHALEVFKSKDKPFYVSMGDYAASGGYYISCGADKIYAEPLTLTGSIGIFGMIPCVKELANDKIGVNFDFVTTNANGAQPNMFEPLTPYMRNRLQAEINRGYDLFTKRCADGRKVSQDSIKAIAEGRVWDGLTAKKIGLVDELGSLAEAIDDLADENGYKKYQIVSYPDPNLSFFDMILELNSQMKAKALKDELGVYYPVYRHIQTIKDTDPVQARMEQIYIN
ncbi:MAG: signal peptide peptidase SppA, partial [Muribaculaceae bacterium]|nr:signal peptide peptidase SppA [Muribaculaceae bacterium]